MFITIKQIVNRSFMYTLILLICLSCPVKRELKRVLNIPVSSVEQTEKPNKTQLCQFTIHQSVKKEHYQVAQQVQSPVIHNNFYPVTATSEKFFLTTPCYARSVPIYIYNEQFLI